MKNFREAYKDAVNAIPVPAVTMEQIADEERRKKIVVYRKRRRMAAVASAACVFVLCTAGAAAAAGYAKSIIWTDGYGFKTEDAGTARFSDRGEETVTEAGTEGVQLCGMTADEQTDGGAVPEDAEERMTDDLTAEKETMMLEEEWTERRYTSYEAFADAEQIPLALPAALLSGEEILSEEYTVCGEDFLMLRIETEEHLFLLNQAYYGETQAHASSTVYPGGVCNERVYTTKQGFSWLVVDSAGDTEDVLRIHAAISVGDYELIADFDGYTEEEAFQILNTMDLTVYF